MPTNSKLADAAIAMNKALEALGVDFGIFGGYAIAVLGGPRESKDIDCTVNCTKDWLVEKLSQVEGFRSMGNTRPDLAQFIYGDSGVLIECFPSTASELPKGLSLADLPPASMSNLRTQRVQIKGEKAGQDFTKILDPVFLFKGKLQAAATRGKHSDAADLIFLEKCHSDMLRARNNELNRRQIGKALMRFPHLEYCFQRLGVDLAACKAVTKESEISSPTPDLNSVQNALLFNLRAR
ncbi:hypothetical protein KC343_g2432 [Hortaea werneckii]|nr:hypothetical protein KC323_g9561 [Hortaea werneckii]KAI6860925.1 hypothetical protein KC338_g6773 [Hortaea werneckii]KAI7289714.1 hypothetical protein KC352_g3578 [Hortaea werneckii]KAI7573154.1 hypothetical protein KC317_g128 [Hortaea werneckii]KAI7627942.1 hypothetical protein KC346_g469 [Hortaea werneckii]